MVEDIGLGEWRFDVDRDSSKNITQALDSIYADLPDALKKVETAMQYVRKNQKETMDIVGKTLKG